MGTEQSITNLKAIKRVSLMNQSINTFFQTNASKLKQNEANESAVQLSYLELQMNDEKIIELSYNLMSRIAMTKVNSFNKSVYNPITHFNPFEVSQYTYDADDKEQFVFHTEYSENVNKMFEVQPDSNIPFEIDEDENEDIDNSQQQEDEENAKKEEERESKSKYDQRYISASMKKLITKKKSDKIGSDHLSKFSEAFDSKSSENQVLDSEKRKKTAKAIKENNGKHLTMKPTATLIKSKTAVSDTTNTNVINESSRRSNTPHDCYYNNNNNTTDENEQHESILEEQNQHDNGNSNYAQYYKKNKEMVFKIEIKKLIKEERAKKLYQQGKATKYIKSFGEENKNTTFIDQINKYMELDTSYNVKLNQIKSNKKMPLFQLKKRNHRGKVNKTNNANKINQNTTPSPNLISYNDLVSQQIYYIHNQTSANELIEPQIVKEKEVDSKEFKEEGSHQPQNQPQKQEKSDQISNEDDEFISACSSPYQSIKSNENHFNNTQRKDSGFILNQPSNKYGFYNETKSMNFEEYD